MAQKENKPDCSGKTNGTVDSCTSSSKSSVVWCKWTMFRMTWPAHPIEWIMMWCCTRQRTGKLRTMAAAAEQTWTSVRWWRKCPTRKSWLDQRQRPTRIQSRWLSERFWRSRTAGSRTLSAHSHTADRRLIAHLQNARAFNQPATAAASKSASYQVNCCFSYDVLAQNILGQVDQPDHNNISGEKYNCLLRAFIVDTTHMKMVLFRFLQGTLYWNIYPRKVYCAQAIQHSR